MTTYTQLKEIHAFTEGNGIDFKDFFNDTFNGSTIDGDFDKFESLVKSIKGNLITLKQFNREDYIDEGGLFYSSEDYVYTREGEVVCSEDAQYCDFYEEFTNGDVTRVFIGRNEYYYCDAAINNQGLTEYRNDYYDCEALSYNDIVFCEDIQEYQSIDNSHFWESTGEWNSEEDESEAFVRDYHNGGFKQINFTKKPKFGVGIEVEKEDQNIKESLNIDDFEENCPNWRKERDGSLNDDSGFELVSPTFELNVKRIIEHINSNPTLVAHINADKSNSCGGHINVSEAGLTGAQLFEKVQGYTPLFYALYHKRIDLKWSKGKSNHDLKRENEKYQAIRIHDNRIEYRIVSAVESVKQLEWRLKLIHFILKNPTNNPKQAFFNVHNKLKPLLKKVYKTNAHFNKLIDRLIEQTLKFENINLGGEGYEETEP